MKYIFTSQFLKVQSPATSFGDAWELLCLKLLKAEYPASDFQRFLPPDRGVDILRRPTAIGYQCKSDERGAFGNAPKQDSLDSLRTAIAHRAAIGWKTYCFATNADYSGNAVEDIQLQAESLGIPKSDLSFLGPQDWSDLCEKHLVAVQDTLDYRLQVTEAQVVEAFRKARFFEHKIEEYQKQIAAGNFVLNLANNRTPLRLSIPFSPDLTIRHCLKVAMQLLGVTLDAAQYSDLETSARPSVSITIDRIPQDFSKKIGELSDDELGRMELWITVIWKDELEQRREDTAYYLQQLRTFEALNLAPRQRGAQTFERYKRALQIGMWRSAATLTI